MATQDFNVSGTKPSIYERLGAVASTNKTNIYDRLKSASAYKPPTIEDYSVPTELKRYNIPETKTVSPTVSPVDFQTMERNYVSNTPTTALDKFGQFNRNIVSNIVGALPFEATQKQAEVLRQPLDMSAVPKGIAQSWRQTTQSQLKGLQQVGNLPSLQVIETPRLNKLLTGFAEAGKETTEKVQQDVQANIPTNMSEGTRQTFEGAMALGQGAQALIPGGFGSMLFSAFGQGAEEAKVEGATPRQQLAAGGLSAGIELATELLPFSKLQKLAKGGGNLVDFGIEVVGETFGEAISEKIQPYAKRVTYDPDAELASWQEVVKAGFTGGVVAMLLGGLSAGIGSAQTAIKTPTVQNVTKVKTDLEQAIGQEIPVTEEQIVNEVEKVINPNKMSLDQMKAELTQAGVEPLNTKSELRSQINYLRQSQVEPIQTIEQQATTAPTGQIQSVAMPTAEATQQATQQLDQLQTTVDSELINRARNIIDNMTTDNLQESFTQIQEIEAEAQRQGIPMNLQLFAQMKEDLSVLEEANVNPNLLEKHQRALAELEAKGVNKTTVNEFKKLIEIKDSINKMKLNNQDKIDAIKARYAEQQQARRDSAQQTKLLNKVRELQRQRLQPEIQKVANELFGNFDTLAKSISSKKKLELTEAKAEIERLKAEGGMVDQSLEQAVARLDKKSISDLTSEEVDELIDVASELIHTSQNINKLLSMQVNETASEYALGMSNDLLKGLSEKQLEMVRNNEYKQVKDRPILDTFTGIVGKPASTFQTLMLELGRGNENSYAYKMYDKLRQQQNQELRSRRQLNELIESKLPNWKSVVSSKEWNAEQNVNGRNLTSGQKVMLKYSLNDPNVSQSLTEKGAVQQGQLSPITYDEAFRESIQLNEQEQALYDVLPELFDMTYNIMNDAHVVNKGYALPYSGTGKHLPKKVAKRSLPTELGAYQNDATLSNAGITKERKGTLNVLELAPIEDIVQRQIDVATKYGAYVNMVRDFNKVLNNQTLKNTLKVEYGAKGDKSFVETYVDDLLKDIQGNKKSTEDVTEKGIKRIRNNVAGAILAFRLTTPLIQTASYPIALTQISPQNLAKGLAQKGGYEEASRYNERANVRSEVGIDRDIAENKQKALLNTGLKAIQYMDRATIGKLWNATKLQVEMETGLTGEELLQATSERFDKVLDTQPNYTTADRSMTMRSQSEITKMLTMFSSAKSSVLNEVKQGYIKGKYTGDWSYLTKAMSGLLTSIVMMAGIDTGLDYVKGDDDKFLDNMMKRASGALPLFDTFSSMINGYDISNVGIDALSDAVKNTYAVGDVLLNLATGEKVSQQKLTKTAFNAISSIALALGIPFENAIDILQTTLNATPFNDLALKFKQYTKPFSTAQFYDTIEAEIERGQFGKVEAMIDNAEDFNIKKENLYNKLKRDDLYNRLLELRKEK